MQLADDPSLDGITSRHMADNHELLFLGMHNNYMYAYYVYIVYLLQN